MRTAAGMAAVVITASLLFTPQAATAAPKVTTPKATAECRALAADRTAPVSGAKYGRCQVGATRRSKTYTVTTRSLDYKDVTTYRHGRTVDFSSKVYPSSDVMRLQVRAIGDRSFLQREPGGKWFEGKRKGRPIQRDTHAFVRGVRSEYARWLRMDEYRAGSAWTFTGRHAVVDGVKVWQYRGQPDVTKSIGPGATATVTEWVDKYFRSVRFTTAIELDGHKETLRGTYRNYGKRVVIKAPKVG